MKPLKKPSEKHNNINVLQHHTPNIVFSEHIVIPLPPIKKDKDQHT